MASAMLKLMKSESAVLLRRSYSSSAPTTKLYIDGQFVDSKTSNWIELTNPATNEVIGRVPEATKEELNAALESAKKAYKSWSQSTIMTRQQVMFKFARLLRDNQGVLAAKITEEQGKTIADAEGDVLRGIQSVEHCCSITSLQLGDSIQNIAKDMDTHSYKVPLGVVGEGLRPECIESRFILCTSRRAVMLTSCCLSSSWSCDENRRMYRHGSVNNRRIHESMFQT